MSKNYKASKNPAESIRDDERLRNKLDAHIVFGLIDSQESIVDLLPILSMREVPALPRCTELVNDLSKVAFNDRSLFGTSVEVVGNLLDEIVEYATA